MSETAPASNNSDSSNKPEFSRLSPKYFVICVVAFAFALFAWKAIIALGNPIFTGDASVRMLNADRLIARMGNRVWLPYLQWLIWGLARFDVPYSFFNLIPCAHLFLAVLGLGLLGLRFLGRNWRGLLISLAVMFCFAQQAVIARSSTTLYQEITAIALFYLLLYGGALELARRRWLPVVGAAALLTRDSMWFYLFSLTLLNGKTILSDNGYRRTFAFLWSIPPLFLTAVLFGWLVFNDRLPTIPTEWPLMINKEGNQAVSSLAESFRHLWTSAVASRFIFLAIALIVAWIVYAIESKRCKVGPSPASDFAHRLKPFSFLSLAICYGLILLFDPWQYTEGSRRIYSIATEQAFLWILVSAAAVRFYRPAARIITAIALLAGLAASLDQRITSWIPEWNPGKVAVYEEITARIEAVAPGRKPTACMIGDHFEELSDFSAAIYRFSHRVLPIGAIHIPKSCDALFTTVENAPADTEGLVRAKEYSIDDRRYVLHLRRR
ncbi:MAG: hypothetical protein JXA73_01455 [Acidobacteria bacterium]|nr:hypothetical protein [Acidobacteriota bacterium]